MNWELVEIVGFVLAAPGVVSIGVGGVILVILSAFLLVRTIRIQWKCYFEGEELGQIDRKIWDETLAASNTPWAKRAGIAFAFGWFVIVLGLLLVFVVRVAGKSF